MLIIQFLYNLNIFFIVDKFSPSHVAVAGIIGSLASLINSTFILREIDIDNFFIRFALYILLLVAASIHNELIIIRCCGLETHTWLFLEQSAEMDNYNHVNDNNSNVNNENNNNDLLSDESSKISIELFNLEEENSLDGH